MVDHRRRGNPLPVRIGWLTKKQVTEVCSIAYEHRHETPPLETLEQWLAQHTSVQPGSREFERRAGQLANAWLAYVRERHNGQLPPNARQHNSNANKVVLFCVQCGGDLPPLAHKDVRRGRRYCGYPCSNRARKVEGDPYEDTEVRNRQLMRMVAGGMNTADIAEYFGLAKSTVRNIRRREG